MKKQKKNEALIWGARQFLRNCTTAATNAQRYWRGRVTRRANYAITMSLIHRRGVRELKARVIQFAWMRQKIVKRKLWKTRNETTNNNQNGINHIYTCVGLNLQPMQSTVTTKKSSPTRQAKEKKEKQKERNEEGNEELTEGKEEEGKKEEEEEQKVVVEFISSSLLTYKMSLRALHWKCVLEVAEKGRVLPYAKDIQRVYRGHVGRSRTAHARKQRKCSMTIQNKLIRKYFARCKKKERQNVVNLLGKRVFQQEKGVFSYFLIQFFFNKGETTNFCSFNV